MIFERTMVYSSYTPSAMLACTSSRKAAQNQALENSKSPRSTNSKPCVSTFLHLQHAPKRMAQQSTLKKHRQYRLIFWGGLYCLVLPILSVLEYWAVILGILEVQNKSSSQTPEVCLGRHVADPKALRDLTKPLCRACKVYRS